LTATSEVIGLKENSSRKTGTVYVRSRGRNQHRQDVLEYVRWVMVRKRDETAAAPGEEVPALPEAVEAGALGGACPILNVGAWDPALAGGAARLSDYKPGERLDHVAGTTVDD